MSSINILGSGVSSSFSAYAQVRAAKEQEDAVAVAPDAVQNQPSEEKAASTPSAPRNLMEGNFVQQNTEESRYIKATLSGLQIENELGNKLNNVVAYGRIEATLLPGNGYAPYVLAGKRTARRTGEVVEGEVSETETERMETERKRVEEEQEQEQEEKVSGESQDSAETVSAQEYIEEKSDQASGEDDSGASGTESETAETVSAQEYIEKKSDQASGPEAETAPVQAVEFAGTQEAGSAYKSSSKASGVDQYV